MWKVKDFFINLFLTIRLWFIMTFKPKRFKNVINERDKQGWDLTFNDEFDKGDVDRDKWLTQAYYGKRYHPGNIINKGTAPDTYYSDDCFEFSGSNMKQVVKNEPIEIQHVDWDGKDWGKFTIPYQIGQLDSSKSFEQKYGYFEIRSKITSEPGSWPAFWLASVHLWPPEIDVYEIYTGRKKGVMKFNSNFHWRKKRGDRDEENNKSKVKSHRVLNVSKDFHLYAVEWNSKGFKIYYDNLLVRVFTNPETIYFFDYPMHIIVGSGIHIDQGPEKAKYPNYHEVDYVRAYKKQ